MPSEIIVIDHLPGHAAVDTNVFARDEACLVGTEIQHHIGNVHGWSAIIKTESPSAREYGKIGVHEEEFRWLRKYSKRDVPGRH